MRCDFFAAVRIVQTTIPSLSRKEPDHADRPMPSDGTVISESTITSTIRTSLEIEPLIGGDWHAATSGRSPATVTHGYTFCH